MMPLIRNPNGPPIVRSPGGQVSLATQLVGVGADVRVTESGEDRLTESGEQRVIE